MKSEPEAFSIENLENSADRTTSWDGVRNYQARNFMRDDMKVGDNVLFYHSGKTPCLVGVCEVVREGYPDHTAWDPQDPHFDPKSSPKNPIWYMVDIRLKNKFKDPVPLKNLRGIQGLENMMLIKKGIRLSVQPVSKIEFDIVMNLGGLHAG